MGGDEFVILCKNTDKHRAYTLAEAIRQAYTQIEGIHNTHLSLGVAELKTDMDLSARENIEQLVRQADKAMYKAKQELGGNTVWVYGGLKSAA